MYEVVKVVNGYEIKKYEGAKKCFVNIEEENGIGWEGFYEFNSIKEASAFCMAQPTRA